MIGDLNKWETMGGHCCDPVTMMIVATGAQAFGQFQQGRAAQQSAEYNAAIARQNAERTRQQTEVAKEQQDRERRLRLGANIASGAASGVGIENLGDVMASNAMQEELDLLTLESEGLLRAQDFETQASLQEARGKQAMQSGIMGAGTTILGGISNQMGRSGGSVKPKGETIYWNQGGRTRI